MTGHHIVDRNVHVVARGVFASQVTDALTYNGFTVTTVAPERLEQLFTGDIRQVIAVESRPGRRLFASVDELAFRHRASWLPVANEHRRVRVGPLSTSPGGPCFLCYENRRIQHERTAALDTAIENAWDEGHMAGPELFLPHHVTFAAAQIALTLATGARGEYAFLEKDAGAGTGFGKGIVEAAHGCGRCHD